MLRRLAISSSWSGSQSVTKASASAHAPVQPGPLFHTEPGVAGKPLAVPEGRHEIRVGWTADGLPVD